MAIDPVEDTVFMLRRAAIAPESIAILPVHDANKKLSLGW